VRPTRRQWSSPLHASQAVSTGREVVTLRREEYPHKHLIVAEDAQRGRLDQSEEALLHTGSSEASGIMQRKVGGISSTQYGSRNEYERLLLYAP